MRSTTKLSLTKFIINDDSCIQTTNKRNHLRSCRKSFGKSIHCESIFLKLDRDISLNHLNKFKSILQTAAAGSSREQRNVHEKRAREMWKIWKNGKLSHPKHQNRSNIFSAFSLRSFLSNDNDRISLSGIIVQSKFDKIFPGKFVSNRWKSSVKTFLTVKFVQATATLLYNRLKSAMKRLEKSTRVLEKRKILQDVKWCYISSKISVKTSNR